MNIFVVTTYINSKDFNIGMYPVLSLKEINFSTNQPETVDSASYSEAFG